MIQNSKQVWLPGFMVKVGFMNLKVIERIETPDDSKPVQEWLRKLPRESRRVIGEDIKTVQIGWPLGMPLVRKMDAALWEVRSRIPDGIARVLFTVVGSQMVLLHSFVKKTQKTPANELEIAKRRKQEVHHEYKTQIGNRTQL